MAILALSFALSNFGQYCYVLTNIVNHCLILPGMDQYCHVAPRVGYFFNNTALTQPFLVGFEIKS